MAFRRPSIGIFVTVMLAAVCAGAGVEKSGVKPQVISLPKGPGSIEGLGESFEPQLNSGTTAYAVKLNPPPGRAGLVPDVTLRYNAGGANGPFGLGWSLPNQTIQRQTDKGLPKYDSTDRFVVSGGEELVPLEDGTWRPENESAFTRYLRDGDGWRGEDKSGLVYRYGMTAASRIQSGAKVFCWLLQDITDRNGNTVRYAYSSPDGGPQKYCSGIVYSETEGRRQEIVLEYEQRPDALPDYRPTFRLETSYRCRTVTMKSNGAFVRRYDLSYAVGAAVSLLERVTQVGSDGTSTLPPAVFTYTQFEPSKARLVGMEGPDNRTDAPWVMLAAEPNAALNDMNGDGLPDLLVAKAGDHQVYFNLGVGADGRHRWSGRLEMGDQSPGEALGNRGASLADIDGDGKTDLIARRAVDTYFWWRSLGDGMWAPAQTFADNSGLAFDFENQNVRLVDINNDKHTDIMYCNESSGEYYTYYLNDGTSEFSEPFSLEGLGNAMTFSRAGMKLSDMNGDRLQDIVFLEDGICKYWPSTGVGEWDMTRRGDWDAAEYGNGTKMFNPPDSELNGELSLEVGWRSLMLVDMNGDGLTDILYVPEGAERVMYWLNRDALHFEGPLQLTGTPVKVAGTVVQPADMNGNGTTDILWSYSDDSRTIARSILDGTANEHPEFDLNGDGKVDVADSVVASQNAAKASREKSSDPSIWMYLDFCPDEKPHLLKTATNGIGRVLTFNYTTTSQEYVRDRASRPWTSGVPNPVNILASYEEDDAQGHKYKAEFKYHDGYYDSREKEFRGFAASEKHEFGDETAPGLLSSFEFDTGRDHEVLKGKPLSMKIAGDGVADGAGLYYREEYTWNARELLAETGGGARRVSFAEQLAKEREITEQGNGAPVTLRWEYEYDDYGNMIRQEEYGRSDGAWGDERTTETTYTSDYSPGVSAWILDKVVETTTRDGGGVMVAQKRNYYDGSVQLGEIVKGNMTREDDWVGGTSYVTSVRNDYDAYGNIVAIYDALFDGGGGHYRQIQYDGVFHIFPVQELIHTGGAVVPTLSMQATYDYGLGVMRTSTEFNGHTTYYDYDKFGRLVGMTKPPDSTPTVSYDYELNHPLPGGRAINWVSTYQHDGKGGTVASRTFYDGLGRKIMTRSNGEEGGQVVVTDTVIFNARKQPARKYLPYFETGTLDYVDPTYQTGCTQHLYDAMAREIRVTQPDQTYSTTTYSPMARLVRDEEQTNPASPHFGCGMRYVEDGLLDKDGRGRLREVYEIVKLSDLGEPLGAPVEWLTQYSYDTLGGLTGYVDSQGNKKHITYDGLGRKTFMNDPDRGRMTYEYDAAGNLVRTTDAKGQVIRYEYDGVNRLAAEYYNGADVPAVEYHYDEAAGPVSRGELYPGTITAENVKGYLAWVKDQSGEEHNSYDGRGRVIWTIKGIIDTGPDDLKRFYTGFEYDSMDRVSKLTYPDQTFVTHAYNGRGLLESIPNVVNRCDYNPAGQNARLDLACGTITTYGYDNRLRLSRLHTLRTRDSLNLQDLNYAYDGVSNITHITDGRTGTELNTIGAELGIDPAEAGKFNATQTFQYDSLYRLTQSANAEVYGSVSHRYDRIGNMISQNAALIEPDPLMNLGEMTSGGSAGTHNRDGRAPSDPPGPHAITGTTNGPAGAMNFTYDDNGNMLGDDIVSINWDSRDRLIGTLKESEEVQYNYDYADSRTKKTIDTISNNETAYYINKYCEFRGVNLCKYVYSMSNKVASLNNNKTTNNSYYLYDHVGSVSISLNFDCQIQGQFSNHSYGRSRKEVALGDTYYKYAGKEYDMENGLKYFETRFMSESAAGRFISVDSAIMSILDVNNRDSDSKPLLPKNLNCYTYASANPAVLGDPTGEIGIVLTAVIGGVTGAGIGAGIAVVSELMSGKATGASVLSAAAGGAVSGGITGLCVGSGGLAATFLVGFGSSAAGKATELAVSSMMDPKSAPTMSDAISQVGSSALVGGFGGAITSKLSGVISNTVNKVTGTSLAIQSSKEAYRHGLEAGISKGNTLLIQTAKDNAARNLARGKEMMNFENKMTELALDIVASPLLGMVENKINTAAGTQKAE